MISFGDCIVFLMIFILLVLAGMALNNIDVSAGKEDVLLEAFVEGKTGKIASCYKGYLPDNCFCNLYDPYNRTLVGFNAYACIGDFK